MAISLAIFGRILHLKEFIDWYNGEPEDGFATETDLSAQRAALTSAQNTVVDNFESTYTTGLNTQKTGVDDLFTVFKSMWPFESEAAFIDAADTLATGCKGLMDAIPADFATLKTDLATEVTNEITDDGATVSITAVLNKIITDYQAALTAAGRTVKHGRCNGNGQYLKSQDTGIAEDATIKKLCPGCQATGFLPTSTTDIPTQTFPVVDEYPEEIEIPE